MASSRTSSGGVHLGVAVLAGVQVEHELAERALQPRQRALEDHEARARELRPPPRNPSGPSASPISKCCFGAKPMVAAVRGSPSGAARHCRARPRRPARRRAACWGGRRARRRARRRSPSPRPRRAASASFSAATSAFSASARALSLAAIAWPISLDSALRRSCASCAVWMAARRRSSMREEPGATAARRPGLASPSSNAAAFSRIHLMSYMRVSPGRTRGIPAPGRPSARRPATRVMPAVVVVAPRPRPRASSRPAAPR